MDTHTWTTFLLFPLKLYSCFAFFFFFFKLCYKPRIIKETVTQTSIYTFSTCDCVCCSAVR